MKKITVLTVLLFLSCRSSDKVDQHYRQLMRDFVNDISQYSHIFDANFIIIPQNGHELLTENSMENGTPDSAYIVAINGIGREELFYGYTVDNVPTPAQERDNMITFLDIAEDNSIEVLTIDYCWDYDKIDDSYQRNNARNYISFAADHRELDNIPNYPVAPYNENFKDINNLTDAMNFLYLLNSQNYAEKTEMLSTLAMTNFDIIIMDLFFDNTIFNLNDLNSIRYKANGGRRLLIAYLSIGEAESYRYYWHSDWNANPPSWLAEENPDWPGNFKVFYWDPEWQQIIFGNDSSYVKKIIDAGFDGVYLDIIDAYEYFE